jgi:hypothetical protein
MFNNKKTGKNTEKGSQEVLEQARAPIYVLQPELLFRFSSAAFFDIRLLGA